MSRKCDLAGTKHQTGNRVSHANNKTKHRFQTNLQHKKIFVPELEQFVKVRVTARTLRTIDKLGLLGALKSFGLELSDVM